MDSFVGIFEPFIELVYRNALFKAILLDGEIVGYALTLV
jgi:hypothetical protein